MGLVFMFWFNEDKTNLRRLGGEEEPDEQKWGYFKRAFNSVKGDLEKHLSQSELFTIYSYRWAETGNEGSTTYLFFLFF